MLEFMLGDLTAHEVDSIRSIVNEENRTYTVQQIKILNTMFKLVIKLR